MQSELSEDVKIMAGVGHICLQCSRLEMALLGVIYAFEHCPAEKGEMIYGGLDILPRCNMAIKLSEYHKAPRAIQEDLKAVRKALQTGLLDKRNTAVHGAQKPSKKDGRMTFTMVRFRGDKRDTHLGALDLYTTGHEIFELGNKAWAVFEAIGVWQFGDHARKNDGGEFSETHPRSWFKFAQSIYTSFNDLWRKL